ncbi:MAG: HDOD domain-containing protein, partial [Clostridiales bacterium]|nr:HDOD domain-containing protein [Clostridiales bacterium]
VLESVNPGDNIVERCRKLKELGYTIALDDFVYSPEYESLLSLVDIIKIDFLISKKPEIEGLLRRCRNSGIKFLAEKVETHKEFEYAKRHGFKLFQGYFFSKPEVVKGSCLSPLKVNCLQLIKEVNREEINFNLLSNIISRDISMTYNLLRLVNSAAFGFRSKVTSVKQASVVLGEREIRKWMTLVALNDLGKDKPDEIVRQSLIRARFAELVAEKSKFRNNSDNYFVAGLFSMLDVLLDRPLGEILEEIHAPEGIMDCMLDHDNTTGSICKLMMSYEACEWQEVAKQAALLGIKNDVVVDSYVNALIWYSQIA